MNIKKHVTKALAFLFLSNSLLMAKSNIVQAADYWPNSVGVTAESAIIMEQETGTILYSKNMDDEHFPASITKIMTALIVLENCDLYGRGLRLERRPAVCSALRGSGKPPGYCRGDGLLLSVLGFFLQRHQKPVRPAHRPECPSGRPVPASVCFPADGNLRAAGPAADSDSLQKGPETSPVGRLRPVSRSPGGVIRIGADHEMICSNAQ